METFFLLSVEAKLLEIESLLKERDLKIISSDYDRDLFRMIKDLRVQTRDRENLFEVTQILGQCLDVFEFDGQVVKIKTDSEALLIQSISKAYGQVRYLYIAEQC